LYRIFRTERHVTDPLALLATALEGRYVIEREIGSGGTAVVFRARDLRHHRLVAIKVLRPELARSLGPDRFLREIRIAASLTHPHILPVHDSGEAADLLYYVMPYVEGESLRSRLIREGALPMDDALRVAREVADALSYAHSRGVVHRDIKPGNILLVGGHAVVADFGIATATDIGMDDETLTSPGLVIGTPAYMSPEQARGEPLVDGRSDLYSLGCVLYEMLTGRPPFTGASAQAVLARHSHDAPEPLRARRPSVPVEVEEAVQRLLEKLPADRFSTAAQFAAALPADSTEQTGARRPRLALRWSGAAAVLAVGAAAVLALQPPRTRLDDSLYVVLPFRHRGDTPAPLLEGDQCGSLLHDALRRWRDISVVDPLWISDARARAGDQPLTLETGLALARVRGAGAMLAGEVWQVGESVYVRGALYDVARNGRAIRQHTVSIAPDLSDANAQFERLASALVVGESAAAETNHTPSSVAAWRSYEAGREALLRWDLGAARANLTQAVQEDPQYAAAHLALATALSWSGEPPEAWRNAAAAAAGGTAAPEDRSRALALLALADRRYEEACTAFREQVARDSLDFAAWLGLGDCLARDARVERDPSSRSGWRFRTSDAEAVNAYRRALEAYPSVHRASGAFALRRLERVLYTEPHHYREGFALAPDTLWFGAFPALEHDTIAFVPYPLPEALSFRPPAYPPTTAEAVSRARGILRSVTATWVRAFPESPEALEVHALALETDGLVGDGPPLTSALAAVVAARQSARDTSAAFRLALAETRVRLKRQEFGAARRLADSLLLAAGPATPERAANLAALAALTGRPTRAATLLARSEPSFEDSSGVRVSVPGPVAEAALAYVAYAALGAPAESLAATSRRARRRAGEYVEPARRAAVELALVGESGVLAFPASPRGGGSALGGGHPLVPALEALRRGDPASARAILSKLHARRRLILPGSVAADATFVEAWLMVQLGDSSAAGEFLDQTLGALPTQRTALLDETPQAAGLVRAMALRAELGAAAGDQATAGRWGSAVATLWAGAEPSLGPIVSRMRALSVNQRR
jgi:tRNA A-37 threonylcarbamoyl transferase component Bud32/tetratricopeptide (TPR) repeat protein